MAKYGQQFNKEIQYAFTRTTNLKIYRSTADNAQTYFPNHSQFQNISDTAIQTLLFDLIDKIDTLGKGALPEPYKHLLQLLPTLFNQKFILNNFKPYPPITSINDALDLIRIEKSKSISKSTPHLNFNLTKVFTFEKLIQSNLRTQIHHPLTSQELKKYKELLDNDFIFFKAPPPKTDVKAYLKDHESDTLIFRSYLDEEVITEIQDYIKDFTNGSKTTNGAIIQKWFEDGLIYFKTPPTADLNTFLNTHKESLNIREDKLYDLLQYQPKSTRERSRSRTNSFHSHSSSSPSSATSNPLAGFPYFSDICPILTIRKMFRDIIDEETKKDPFIKKMRQLSEKETIKYFATLISPNNPALDTAQKEAIEKIHSEKYYDPLFTRINDPSHTTPQLEKLEEKFDHLDINEYNSLEALFYATVKGGRMLCSGSADFKTRVGMKAIRFAKKTKLRCCTKATKDPFTYPENDPSKKQPNVWGDTNSTFTPGINPDAPQTLFEVFVPPAETTASTEDDSMGATDSKGGEA